MNNVIIFHGAYGYPSENWFEWLKNELFKLNIECHVPQFPTPENQNLSDWLQLLNTEYRSYINPNSILIGHSLGSAFILRWLEKINIKLPLVILTGSFTGNIGINKFDNINKSFFENNFDWSNIRDKANQFICYHGDNDPYVLESNFDLISQHLYAKKVIISKGGHLNTAAGFSQFHHLLFFLKQFIIRQ